MGMNGSAFWYYREVKKKEKSEEIKGDNERHTRLWGSESQTTASA